MESGGFSLDRLADAMANHPTARFIANMERRFPDSHLKDLIVSDMDDQRGMTVLGRRVTNFGSDGFLGLDRDKRVQQAIIDGVRRWGTHNGASRIFSSVEVCDRAEAKLARWLGVEATLIFPSVTLANVGLLPGLVGPGDLLAVDRFAHDSIHQGVKIAHDNGAQVNVFDSCTAEALAEALGGGEFNTRLAAVDGVYSMTGATPPLRELHQATKAAGGVLYIDDAHGTGIVGDHGRGTAASELGGLDDVLMIGSLSKAFSCMGAFVTCTARLKHLLKMACSTYLFGGPVPPPYLEGVCVVCDILMSDEYERIIGSLRQRIRRLIDGLRGLDLVVLGDSSAIISVLVKDRARAFQAGKWLFDRGFYVQSVTYPAVPVNGSVLRIQVNANHALAAIDGLVAAMGELRGVVALPAASQQGQPLQA